MKMDVVRRRAHKIRSDNASWHLDSTHKLVNYKFAVSGAVDRFNCQIVWLKCSNNNRGNTYYDFLKKPLIKKRTATSS